MELRELSMFEAEQNDLPAREPGEGEIRSWYALVDEDRYKGFMETTQYEDMELVELSYLMIPDIYQGEGLSKAMLALYLDSYIPSSTPEGMLTTFFEYSGEYGEAFLNLFSSYGFDISFRSFRKYVFPLEEVRDKFAPAKNASYKGRMINLAEGINEALSAVNGREDMEITVTDVRESDLEFSVAAFDPDDQMIALMLISVDSETGDAVITDLYITSDDVRFVRRFFGFAAEDAWNAVLPPANISFTAADERLERLMETVFSHPKTTEAVMAEGEFNLGKYVEQLKLEQSMGVEV